MTEVTSLMMSAVAFSAPFPPPKVLQHWVGTVQEQQREAANAAELQLCDAEAVFIGNST